MKQSKRWGSAWDALLLTAIKLVTIVLGFTVTRLLSEHLTVYDYGTYSQVLLVVSTVSSLTILGMMDGVNYFYCRETDTQLRESYIAVIFALQCILSTAAGILVLALCHPLCRYFNNPSLKGLLVFAACLPLLQNLISMLQVLLVSVGKARLLALRNLAVSLIRLAVVLLVVYWVKNVAVILTTTLTLDIIQIGVFVWILKGSGCRIRPSRIRWELAWQILSFCVPMAVFTAVNALSRDCDKYLIALATDTQTLAVYANASKVLPFDIIMGSFCTVLLPRLTRHVAQGEKREGLRLYRNFLEIAYISTTVLCCAALAAAPQLMELLYSQKYLSGLAVFCIYILVDLLRFTNLTMVLSAAGKTRLLMALGLGTLGLNAALNVALYAWLGVIGPAVSTLIATLVMGLFVMVFGSRELGGKLRDCFDLKFLALFTGGNLLAVGLFSGLQRMLAQANWHYFWILLMVCGGYCLSVGLIYGKRLLHLLRCINQDEKREDIL